MSQDKSVENDPERTLVTLEQLSQTIEVMTSVVNRLRQHLSEQLHAKAQSQGSAAEPPAQPASPAPASHTTELKAQNKESIVVEIQQQEILPTAKSNKTLH